MNAETVASALTPTGELEFAQEMISLISGIDVGVAVYNANNHLLTANENFYKFHSIHPSYAPVGCSLNQAVYNCLLAKQLDGDVDEMHAKVMAQLSKPGDYRIEAENRFGEIIRVSRHRKPNGFLIETVSILASDANAIQLRSDGNISHHRSINIAQVMYALDSMSDGFAIYDPDGMLVLFNQAYKTLNAECAHKLEIGANHADIIGAVYDSGKVDMNGMTRDEFLEFARQERINPSGPTVHRTASGEWMRYSAHLLDDGSSVYTVSNITKLKEHESENQRLGKEVEDQKVNMAHALATMSQGICMYDREGKAIFFNDQYLDQFHMDKSLAKPGVSRFELVKSAVDAGVYDAAEGQRMLAKYRDNDFALEEGRFLHHFKDGSVMEVHNKPLPGGEVIVTGTDVTQREAAAQQIKDQQQRLSEALESMSQGLGLYDQNQRLIICNDQYLEMSNIDPKLGLPGTSREELVRSSIENEASASGDACVDVERLTSASVSNKQELKFIQEMSDGRLIEIHNRPLSDGRIVVTKTDVTRREKNAALIDMQRMQMEEALKSMSQGLCFFDENDRVILFNEQYRELAGASEDTLKPGVHRLDLLREAMVGSGNHSTKEIDDYVAQFEQNGFPKEESTYLHHFGNGRVMEVFNRPLPDGKTIVTSLDVTQREKDAARIAEQQEHITNTLAVMSQGMCLYDKHQKVVFANENYATMLGLSHDAVQPGSDRLDILKAAFSVHSKNDEQTAKMLERFEYEGFPTEHTTFLQHVGDGSIYEINYQPIDDGRTIVTTSNVTRRETDAARIEKYLKSLERSNAELQDFAYVASHDLQEPLRKIEAFGDRLVKKYGEQIPEDGQMYLDRMQNAASRMRQLINDLLSYSRVTSKAAPFVPVDLNEVVSGVLSDIQMRLEDTDGKVNVNGLTTIDCDALQMRQLFQNLLSNALKFQKEGVTPVIDVNGTVKRLTADNGSFTKILEITIADNGIGFEPRFKDQIFAIFKRLHGRMEYEGTGIGLSTCRKIVERHNGSIEADGIPDVGSTFTIQLPIKHRAEAE